MCMRCLVLALVTGTFAFLGLVFPTSVLGASGFAFASLGLAFATSLFGDLGASLFFLGFSLRLFALLPLLLSFWPLLLRF